MTRVIIEGLDSRESLLAAVSVVLETMNDDAAYQHDEHVFVPRVESERPDSEMLSDETEQSVGTRLLAPRLRPTPFIPCPRRGTHLRLTECWMCWSDVMRGAAIEPEVVDLRAWATMSECDE